MINVSEITAELLTVLKADADVSAALGKNIFRNVYINENPNRTPWLGVYRNTLKYDPYTLGGSNNWKGRVGVRLVVQYSSMKDGEDAENKHEALIHKVLTAVYRTPRLNSKTDALVEATVEYAFVPTTATALMAMANIDIVYEVRTNG